ncbi:hypothetical protein [uncultured Microbacterium sp.]|uniref:HAAS signaling domain-containing protein n=1 Tax=uncultured Microbacterium sp. TaxID=191216 RepID=UPI00262AC3A7|nr:hypothetical protein [uncultured Microbacterium sp.]
MTATSEYLARLDDALRSVPYGVAAEIRAGIAEELQSLDANGAAERIAQLGDPAVIAREAMAADEYAARRIPAPAPAPAAAASPASVPVSHSRGFAIAAALALSLGAFVLPVVGWFVGVGLVVKSSLWHTWEKAVAILAPLGVLLLAMVGSIPAWIWVDNVLQPTSAVHSFIVVVIVVVIPASGLWLLWRMRGRTAS